jgi:hypothetical protein
VTKIYIYCLFDGSDNFFGVYSSLKAIHRDALKLANRGGSNVFLDLNGEHHTASLTNLRNIFKGKHDLWIKYRCGPRSAKIVKTKLRE